MCPAGLPMSEENPARLRIEYDSLHPDERELLAAPTYVVAADVPRDLVLRRSARGLELAGVTAKPLRIDFAAGSWRSRLRGPRPALVRAVGAGRRVLDATAGLGRDAFVLAAAGCEVVAIERSPVVAVLLADALQRAAADPLLAAISARIRLQVGDARTLLPGIVKVHASDVVTIDPMFAEQGRAQVRKEAQVLRALVPADTDADALLAAARASSAGRIVVKRQPHQPPLAPDPSGTVRATRVRFDFYLR